MLSYFASEAGSWSHWQWYKRFFGDVIFKSLVAFVSLIPVISKVFVTHDQSVQQGFTVETQLKGLFSWQFLWIAAVLYFAAYLWYILRCPDFIKKYNKYKDYTDYGHNPRWIVWLSQEIVNSERQMPLFFKRMTDKKYFVAQIDTPVKAPGEGDSKVEIREKQTIIFFVYNSTNYQFGMPILDANNGLSKDATEQATNDIFWEIFGRYAALRVVDRIGIMILLFFSLSMFAIIVCEYLASMASVIFKA